MWWLELGYKQSALCVGCLKCKDRLVEAIKPRMRTGRIGSQPVGGSDEMRNTHAPMFGGGNRLATLI